ncbi:hypothetical protein [Modestobacter roseus]|uniref:Uncharacterized protein n=1 Tax=Modestobacter roseus TaxID=1181884 RepID=A0A562IPK9_9ACTN|nr:hypothetical protein [Modestobacter roseus]MQA35091.1 hypothetical protein [Modestobacter roseus]TWH72665.1 hypothetical protein JD78_01185 [Modestobacter roseus]
MQIALNVMIIVIGLAVIAANSKLAKSGEASFAEARGLPEGSGKRRFYREFSRVVSVIAGCFFITVGLLRFMG